MEENVTSLLLYMINWNSLSDITAALLKVASHEPAGVTRIEFVAHEATTRRQVSSNGRSFSARCSNFIHQRRAGLRLKDRISWRWDYASLRAGPKEIKVYRGNFLGTLTLARALRPQAKKIEERTLGFSQGTYRTTVQRTVWWALWLHYFAAGSDPAQTILAK